MKKLFKGSWTEKKAERASLKLLGEIEDRIIELGGLWGDEDAYLEGRADELLADVRTLLSDLPVHLAEMAQERASEGAA